MTERVDLLDLLDVPARADMNEALREWAAEATPGEQATRAQSRRGTDAACSICGKPARDTCLRCERPTCSSHRGVMTGLCDRCIEVPREPAPVPKHPMGAFDDEVPPEHPDVGIDWIASSD